MSKKKIGVFPCGSEVGLEIYRSLKYYRHFSLIGFSSVEDHGKIVYSNYVDGIPTINSEEFLSNFILKVKSQNIDFLIPAMDEVAYLLKKNESLLSCEVVYPDIEIAEVLRRKSKTYERLNGIIKVPKIYNSNSEIANNLPVFVKPNIGYGSRGAKKISLLSEIPEIFDSKLLYTEYLSGEEYTVDCFSGNNISEPLSCPKTPLEFENT